MIEHFDAIVIGTGQAGPALATKLASSGLSVAIVERKFVGGTCVNVGCSPTKAMVASIGINGERSVGLPWREVGPLAAMRKISGNPHLQFAVADAMRGARFRRAR